MWIQTGGLGLLLSSALENIADLDGQEIACWEQRAKDSNAKAHDTGNDKEHGGPLKVEGHLGEEVELQCE